MTANHPTETIDELIDEVERYLAAVEVFRAEGCEPAWASDEALDEAWRLEWTRAGDRRFDSGIFPAPTAA